jgi:hypothetical protein
MLCTYRQPRNCSLMKPPNCGWDKRHSWHANLDIFPSATVTVTVMHQHILTAYVVYFFPLCDNKVRPEYFARSSGTNVGLIS